jgi:hypothetical protein
VTISFRFRIQDTQPVASVSTPSKNKFAAPKVWIQNRRFLLESSVDNILDFIDFTVLSRELQEQQQQVSQERHLRRFEVQEISLSFPRKLLRRESDGSGKQTLSEFGITASCVLLVIVCETS